MASKDGIEVMLWLSPIAKDLLRDVSKTLRGAVPCAPAKLASALADADISEGVLGSAELRKALAAEIKSLGGEISDQTAPAIVDALGKVLSKEVDSIRKEAAATQGKLKKPKTGMHGYSEVKDVAKSTQALSNDWLMWHSAANAYDAKLVSKPPDAVLAERTALAASCPHGPVGELVTALHVLENIGEYIKWEKSLSGSQSPAACIEVKCPFDDKTANEVAIRRVLTTVLAPDVAMKVIGEVAGDASKVPQALKKAAADARKQAVIPMYAAPPAPKEPKDKKAKKGDEGSSKAAAKPAAGAAAKPTAGPAIDAGSFDALHAATATQELQWHLLAYRLDPGTVLSRTMIEPSAEAAKPSQKGKQAASPKQAPASAESKKPAALPSHPGAASPDAYQNVWSVSQGFNPPGHTDSSWASSMEPDKSNFASTFACGANRPPGHTEMSWRSTASSCGATLPAAKTEKAKAAPKAASPKASPKAAPAAASGPVDEAAVKAVGDEIRILKENLKSSGVTGKKLNDHPEIIALVAKLAALKSGAAAAGAAPKAASPKAAPKSSPEASGSVEDQIKAVGDEIRELKDKLKLSGIIGKKLNDHSEVVALVAKLSALKSGK